MQEKLFEIRQVLLIIGEYPSYFEKEVSELIADLGFTSKIKICGKNAFVTKNLYSGYFEGPAEGGVLQIIKEQVYENCRSKGIGMLDFFLIDSTDAPMFKSIWHDGFY